MDILPGINDEERLIMLKKGVDYSEQQRYNSEQPVEFFVVDADDPFHKGVAERAIDQGIYAFYTFFH